MGDGTYTVIMQAKNERDALRMAQNDAEVTCKKATGRKAFVAVEHKSTDVGPQIAASKQGGLQGTAASGRADPAAPLSAALLLRLLEPLQHRLSHE